jgi:hypothetical protein
VPLRVGGGGCDAAAFVSRVVHTTFSRLIVFEF